MKEDSEKVPTLLTDYILKGKENITGLNHFLIIYVVIICLNLFCSFWDSFLYVKHKTLRTCGFWETLIMVEEFLLKEISNTNEQYKFKKAMS